MRRAPHLTLTPPPPPSLGMDFVLYCCLMLAATGTGPPPQDNDIVLCDGCCCRAYHERCLDPPLRAADLPEDEGWLCPACDAKVRVGRVG